MTILQRGEIYYINFPYTFDPNYPNGKPKFVLVLQEGEYFKEYDTVTVLLITSDFSAEYYDTNVTIELGTTSLKEKSYILCSQPYTIRKSLFRAKGVWSAGQLSPEIMDEVDEAIYLGLCMGQQHEDEISHV
ncbi:MULTISPECIES: type II toxin-antitoxin system PemK/MazF family toxin [unclassified Bacillus (in: firmicutes)]|uniref:type II toxin-antitoxin system PemK/MazF family toxin n=1 Tax=Bacillus TaxID=1386 RepID=UPI0013EE6AEB|nr:MULTISPECIES: type II toxin-antitoxin system PemK/MazF family toxin [unclassified Bacillus (in: firmicutes)]KAF6546285.1 type II toxin-antitoxin system PemK/MazF family toxin [Bacillus sp. EKM207B]KAF6547378.1 type II toxin-antitoxin system PemK/MazF family toxin [Bacillus sp. EKM206B]MBL3611828.1 type II toxin-antitoxin system PemK/MazF family toxin [Bacillus sp. RHFS18]